MTAFILEIAFTFLMGVIVVFFWWVGKVKELYRQAGWWYIVAAFLLLFLGHLLAVCEYIPSVQNFLAGAPPFLGIFLEHLFGHLLAVLLLAIGMVKWIPSVVALNEARRKLQQSHDELEKKVEERTEYLEKINQRMKREIEERALIEGELRKFKTVCDRANYGVAISNLKEEIVYCNREFARMHGYLPEKVVGKNLSVFHNGEQAPSVKRLVEKIRREGGFSGEEVWHARKDGSVFPTLMTGAVIRDAGERPFLLAATAIDISSRKKREEEMVRLSSALAGLAEMVLITGLDHRIIYANPAAEKILGYAPEELVGRPASDIFEGIPGNPPHLDQVMEAEIVDGTWQGELLNRKKNGDLIDVHLTMTRLKNEKGSLIGYVGITRDITERIKAEKKIQEAYRIISRSPAIAFTWRNQPGWPIEFVSENVKNLFGYTAEEFMSGAVAYGDLIFPDDRERVMEEVSTFSSEAGRDEFTHKPYRIITRDGEPRWLNDWTYIVRNERGEITHYKGIVEDISEKRRAEEEIKTAYRELKGLKSQLIQAEKLSAIGLLAAGVAHELNSPLDGLMTLLRLNKKQSPEGSPAREQLAAMLNAAEHMAAIIRDLTSFARESTADFSEVDLNQVIESTLSFSGYQVMGRGISMTRKFSDDLLKINGDRGQLQQVVLNLLTNARDALIEGGVIRITTGNSPDNRSVIMEFHDSGVGIPKENLAKLFDPFFTTKKPGEGIGLGLSVVYGIVEDHGGEIVVKSKPGQGTTFTVRFPAGGREEDGPAQDNAG